MFDMKNIRWILLAAIVLIVFGMQGTLPKEAVADMEGNICTEDTKGDDCPCWGELETGQEAMGIGVASCIDCGIAKNQNRTGCVTTNFGGPFTSGMHCDMAYCYDIEPVIDYLRDNPWQWLKDSPMIMAGIVGLILLLVFWPKS